MITTTTHCTFVVHFDPSVHKSIIDKHQQHQVLHYTDIIYHHYTTQRHIGKITEIPAKAVHIIKTMCGFFRYFMKFY
jgi:hypothetical protein